MAEKPAVLIIGGLGYIGRFLALHIHQKNLASEVRIVDKVLPQLAWLAPEFEEACSKDKFMQADASKEREFIQKKRWAILCAPRSADEFVS
jgi:nucleoside-diphosphate-sugar epimerase